MLLLTSLLGALFAGSARGAALFPFERVQLGPKDIGNFSAVDFGDASDPDVSDRNSCRAFPGTADWPRADEWARLNATMDGALLRPTPLGAACYPGHPQYDERRCRYLAGPAAGFSRTYIDDPLTVLTQWPEGETCEATAKPHGNCTQGGFPVYVANASTVKTVQAAVNFARNKHVRLVIKNTGHDFGGRNVGAGSLSVWTHHLKDFEFLPSYRVGSYRGMAVRYGSGLETWELFNHMAAHNITMVAAGVGTVGAGGGWFGYGGHGYLTSFYGLGSDQALSIEVVTADGRLVTADPNTNRDLFYAIRGGGGATFGVVTSVVMKAYPPIDTTSSSLSFQVVPPSNASHSGNATTPPPSSRLGFVPDADTFWRGVGLYLHFSKKIVEAGGLGFNYVYPLGNGSFSFTTTSTFPNKTAAEVTEFMEPLYRDLHRAHINVTNPRLLLASRFGSPRPPTGAAPRNTRYRSRFFPARNWDDAGLWNQTLAAIRDAVEAGYTFHGNCQQPSRRVAGWPGRNSAVNPAWRRAVLHAMLMGEQPAGLTATQAVAEQDRIGKYMDRWRALTPGSGAYMNEGDPAEPNWQATYFGDNYERLLQIKQRRDPWGVFWAPTTVGSEAWEVRTADGYPLSQNGRLCRVASDGEVGDGGDDGEGDGDEDDGDDGEDGDDDGDDEDDEDDEDEGDEDGDDDEDDDDYYYYGPRFGGRND